MSGKSPWTRTVIMYPSPNLQNIEISLNTSTSAVLETSNLLITPLALTITPIFGERESLFSTRIPIKILLFCSETKWMRWSKRWVTSAHFIKVALLSKKVDSVSTILLWYEYISFCSRVAANRPSHSCRLNNLAFEWEEVRLAVTWFL